MSPAPTPLPALLSLINLLGHIFLVTAIKLITKAKNELAETKHQHTITTEQSECPKNTGFDKKNIFFKVIRIGNSQQKKMK